MVEEEQRGRDDARDAASKAERRAADIASQLEDLRAQLEQVCWLYLTFTSFHVWISSTTIKVQTSLYSI